MKPELKLNCLEVWIVMQISREILTKNYFEKEQTKPNERFFKWPIDQSETWARSIR